MAKGAHKEEVHLREALGRLTGRVGEHSRTAYRYDALGQLTEACRTPTEAGVALGIECDTVQFDYDAVGQLLAEHGVHGTLTYERDALGNPLTLSLPQGQRIGTLYYGSGHVHQMRFNDAVIADFERDDLHREIVRTQGRLATHTGYTQLGQVAWQRASVTDPARPGIPGEAESELWRRYTYGSDDELSGIHDRHAGHTLYEYDRAGQLVRRSASGSTRRASHRYAANAARCSRPPADSAQYFPCTRANGGCRNAGPTARGCRVEERRAFRRRTDWHGARIRFP
ncbi:hypothetical protein PQR53_01465 [Paraburkholderia fungorum]|uniref:hypothetical protein n=1 Tax=Paraburkholderia fungorum TaxID=134537 RepID=UPI0038BA011E